MGPITLFDKSFVQSLSVDESVWFDRFFYSVICPIFYVETLADLAKTPKNRTAEEEVKIIATKFPEVHSNPCMNHTELCVRNILGFDVPMDGRIPRPGGRYVKGGGKTGVVYDQSMEELAFHRWQRQQFDDVERISATLWRDSLAAMDLSQIVKSMQELGSDKLECKSLEKAKQLAENIVSNNDHSFKILRLAIQYFGIPQEQHEQISKRWIAKGRPAFNTFAPYAAYVLIVEIFFNLSIAKGLISSERNSNRTDIVYLFYLPFCIVFVSNDRLHKNTAPLFLRPDQEFLWGISLKEDLKKLNEFYLQLPEATRNTGLMRFADHPPTSGNFLVTQIWRRHLSPTARQDKNLPERDSEREKKLVKELRAFTEGAPVARAEISNADDDQLQALSIERNIHRKKGSWWQVPKDLPDKP
jgi:hypothetical protein